MDRSPAFKFYSLAEAAAAIMPVAPAMNTTNPIIRDGGRGPAIAGTRVTVYDVLDYHKHGWHHSVIAAVLEISSAEVLAAVDYIEAHRDEVMAAYQGMLDRHGRGNPPQVQARLDESHARLMSKVDEQELHQRRLNVTRGTDARAAG